jgi:hypothetical protein
MAAMQATATAKKASTNRTNFILSRLLMKDEQTARTQRTKWRERRPTFPLPPHLLPSQPTGSLE